MSNSSMGDMQSSESPNYRRINENYLLSVIKNQLGITEEDMESPHMVKSKVRDSNIDKVLEKR